MSGPNESRARKRGDGEAGAYDFEKFRVLHQTMRNAGCTVDTSSPQS